MSTDATEARAQRADTYFKEHLKGQREWYSQRAGRYKALYRALAAIVLTGGALTAFVQVFVGTTYGDLVPWVTGLLGLVITVSKGLDQIIQPGQSWAGYRKASEAMKREYRLYINKAGDYAQARKEEQAYARLVERIENIISEEQQLFWPSDSTAKAGTEKGSG